MDEQGAANELRSGRETQPSAPNGRHHEAPAQSLADNTHSTAGQGKERSVKSSGNEASTPDAPHSGALSLSSTLLKRAEVEDRRRRRRTAILVRAWQIVVIVAVLGLWQLTTTQQWVDPVLAKTPAETWAYLVEATGNGELGKNTWATLFAVLLAWVLAGAVGAAVGLTLGLLPRTERVVGPILEAFNAMPRIALAPVLIIYFGIGASAKVALAFSLAFFIVASGTRAGVRSADSELLRLSTIFGASRRQIVQTILLPGAVPSLFESLRLGLIYSLLGVVGSEIIGSQDGLGQLIAKYSGLFEMNAVYGILILLAVIATVFNQAMVILEERLLRWQATGQQ
jgi:NitT/TauT family transport system permease protein